MKRWKQVFEIKEDNFVNLALMPCVTEISKITRKLHFEGESEAWKSTDLFILIGKQSGTIGDFLVQDVCEHWEIYPKKIWDKIKDEEI